MSPAEKVQHAMAITVHASAFQILSVGPIPNHDDVYIQRVIDSIWGLEWYNFTTQTQRANNYYLRQAYQEMLDSYLPKLRRHLEETEGILRQHSTRLAGLVFQPDEAQKWIQTTRNQEAKEMLGDKYDTYKQGLEHVVKRRAEGPVSKASEVELKTLGTDLNGKKQCPECDKTFTAGAFQRHYRQVHVQDVRRAVYCPEEDCEFIDWGGESRIDNHLLSKHSQVLNKKKIKTGTGKAKSETKSEAKSEAKSPVTKPAALESQEIEQAEQAQDLQGEDGGGARGNETVDVEMAEDCILFADTSDQEEMGDLST